MVVAYFLYRPYPARIVFGFIKERHVSHSTKTCPGCGQSLRIPEELGGVAMACPNCGQRIPSFFKLGSVGGVPASPRPASAPPLEPNRLLPMENAAERSSENAFPQESPLPRISILSASGLTRYKLMQREG